MKIAIQLLLVISISLLSSISAAQVDTLSTKSYDELRALLKFHYGNNDSIALAVSKTFIKKSIEDGDVQNQRAGYEVEASIYQSLGDKRNFTKAIEKALETTLASNDLAAQERIYYRAAQGYYFLTDWAQSINYYDKLRNIAITKNDKFTESSILSTMAFINTRAGDVEKGLLLNKEALSKTKQIKTLTDSVTAIKNQTLVGNHYTLTSAYLTLENPDSALYHIDEALKLTTIADSCSIKYLYFMQADGWINKNDLRKAEQSLDNAEQICTITSKDALLQKYAYRGEIALNKKEYRVAVANFLNAFRAFNVREEQEGLMGDMYKLTAKAYKGLGKLDSANIYLEKYINTSNELDRMKSDIYSVAKRQEAASFKKELKALSEQKAQKDNLLLYGGIAGGIIIILLMIGLARSTKKRKENEQKFEALLAKVAVAKRPEEIIDTKDEVLEEQSTTDVNPKTTQQILDGLKKLEDQNYFLHPACSAHNVAKRIKTNTTYLSKVINAEFGKNFSTYVNDLRINYAIIRLKQDSKFRSYTISSIATELGYKSADSFTKYFKKDTGLLPSFYIKKLNETA